MPWPSMNNLSNEVPWRGMEYVLHFAKFVSVFALIIAATLFAVKITSVHFSGQGAPAAVLEGMEEADASTSK